MSFTRVNIVTANSAANETGCRVSLYKLGLQPAKLRIIFDAAALKLAGIEPGERFFLKIGSGEHLGLMRMEANTSGDLVGRKRERGRNSGKRVTVEFECGHIAQFVNQAEPAKPVQWHVSGGTVEITMPPWAVEAAKSGTPAPMAADEQRRQHNEHMLRRKRMGM